MYFPPALIEAFFLCVQVIIVILVASVLSIALLCAIPLSWVAFYGWAKEWKLSHLFYYRSSTHTFFLLPTVAVGTELDGRAFLEAAWLCWAIGVGSLEDTGD